jgi:hypothetical protein
MMPADTGTTVRELRLVKKSFWATLATLRGNRELCEGATVIVGPEWRNVIGKGYNHIYCDGIRYVIDKEDLEHYTDPIV